MSGGARETRSATTARAALRRVRRRLDRESERAAAFLELVVAAPRPDVERRAYGAVTSQASESLDSKSSTKTIAGKFEKQKMRPP